MMRKVIVFGVLSLIIGVTCYAQYSPQLLKVPLSGAAFIDPEQPANPAVPDDRLKRLEEKVDRILKLLEDAAKDEPDEKSRPEKETSETDQKLLGAALGKCVGCHNDRDAAKKGDKVVLFDMAKDRAVLRDDLRPGTVRALIREVSEGTMPKKSSRLVLTPEEKQVILTEFKARRDEASK